MVKPWWSKKWGNDKKCAITQSRLRPGTNKQGETYVITLECKHRFYRKALLMWWDSNSKKICPLCRKEYDDIF